MIYNLLLHSYQFGAKVAALFRPKPAKMVQGHREVFELLARMRDPEASYIWFHAASLGEFEQGRPLMEAIKKEYPTYKILLTFFSPSGYEVRKNYEGADIICYLPFDTASNARRFVELARPTLAFFVKYEFWQNYLLQLNAHQIPVYSVSSIFRPNQLFFQWYGRGYSKVLKLFTHLFVQDQASKELLSTLGINQTTVVGDTRFDRVLDICEQAQPLPLVERFQQGALQLAKSLATSERADSTTEQPFTLVVGSSWEPDEALILRYFNEHPAMKLVIAPHVVSESHIAHIITQLKRPYIRYSQATIETVTAADCLIIDGYGLLSSIYRYGEVAYIGGGFGVGIHNVLEAAVYSIPVLFGPNNQKFREARALLQVAGAFEITNYTDYKEQMDRFLSDATYLKESGQAAGRYVEQHAGAARAILNQLKPCFEGRS
ncbi:MAG: 3-deoxy-D-manno-octulosonic acid transferase [Phocaeicola sp.]